MAAGKSLSVCPTGYTSKTVSSDRFTLAGCLKDVTDPVTHALTAYQAKGAVTLDGVVLSPQLSSSILTLTVKRTVLRVTTPARIAGTGVYDVKIENVTMGSVTPNIVGTATAPIGGASAFAAAAGDGTYDCSFKPKDGAKFKGFEWLSNVLEVRCTVTPTGFAIGGTVKLPPQLTAGVTSAPTSTWQSTRTPAWCRPPRPGCSTRRSRSAPWSPRGSTSPTTAP
jgi:hypothetical protein